MEFAREYFETSQIIKAGETASVLFGPPTSGKIFVLLDSIWEVPSSSEILVDPSFLGSTVFTNPALSGANLLSQKPSGGTAALNLGPFPPTPDIPPGDPDEVSYQLISHGGTIKFEGSGKLQEFDHKPTDTGGNIPSDTLAYPWKIELTNNSEKAYNIHFRIFYTGNREVLKKEIDFEEAQNKLDEAFANPDQPVSIIIENIKDKEVVDPNSGNKMFLWQTYFRIVNAPAFLFGLFEGKTEMPLGIKYIKNDRVQSLPIYAEPTSFNGKFALRIDVVFHQSSEDPIRFSDNDTLGIWDAGVDLEIEIHRVYLSIFIILDTEDQNKISIQSRVNRVKSYFDPDNKFEVASIDIPHFSGESFNTKLIGFLEQSIDTALDQKIKEKASKDNIYVNKKLLKWLCGTDAIDLIGYEQKLWIKYPGEKPVPPVNK